MEFEDKTVVVTGGSKGIGKGIALAFAVQGAKVAIAARTKADLDDTAEAISAAGGQSLATPCDVSNPDQVEAFAKLVRNSFGPVDVLVNNAGIAPSHKFIDHPDDLWQKTLDINLTGPYLVSKAFVPKMIENGGGRIIMMASIVSKITYGYISAYATSKHGLLGLTRSMAFELNKHNITVNAICPGYMDTPMTEKSMHYMAEKTGMTIEQARKYIEETNPQKRLFEVDEVVHVALMLAGEMAKGITGQAINVDGGEVMW